LPNFVDKHIASITNPPKTPVKITANKKTEISIDKNSKEKPEIYVKLISKTEDSKVKVNKIINNKNLLIIKKVDKAKAKKEINVKDQTVKKVKNRTKIGKIALPSDDKELSSSNNNEIPLREYLGQLRDCINQNWNKSGVGFGSTVVQFKINNNGVLNNIRILSSTGNYDIEQSAIYAVNSCGNFSPPPSTYNKKFISIPFTIEN